MTTISTPKMLIGLWTEVAAGVSDNRHISVADVMALFPEGRPHTHFLLPTKGTPASSDTDISSLGISLSPSLSLPLSAV